MKFLKIEYEDLEGCDLDIVSGVDGGKGYVLK